MRRDRMVLVTAVFGLLACSQLGCAVGLRKTAYVGFRVAEQPAEAEVVPAAGERPADAAPPENKQRTGPSSGAQSEQPAHTHSEHAAVSGHGLADVAHGWFNTAQLKWHQFKAWYVKAYHSTARWPRPYATLSERAFYDAWDVQAHAGKKFRFGLFDYHFVAGTGELNEMGQRRVGQILRELGPEDREIFVQAALSRAETEDRIRNVRAAIQRSPIAPDNVAVVMIKDAPASVTGEEARRAIRQLTESGGRFPRWMDRNVRMRRSNSSGGSGSSSGRSASGY